MLLEARFVFDFGSEERANNNQKQNTSRSARRSLVSHGRYVAFQMAEVAIPRILFADILRLVSELRPPPAVAST